MADVFISYARADEPFAEQLAATLAALGLSVWWDRRLNTGEDWELEIEKQLDAAKSVIVLWSGASVKSRPVRAEARRADNRKKLAPVLIEDVELPLFSSGIQVEKLIGWDGDTAHIEFQDLFAQLTALTGGVAAASHIPRDGVTKLTKEVAEEAEPPILSLPWMHRPIGPFRSLASLVWGLLVISFCAVMGVYRETLFGPYWEGVFLLAGTALLLFLAGERELKPNVKAMVARWLQPQPDAKPLRSIDAFVALFEAVFSKRHFSFRCLWASSLASIGIYAALLLLFIPYDVLKPLAIDLWEKGPRTPEEVKIVRATYVSTSFLAQNAALLFLAVPIANIVVDYLSLWQTRLILRWSARRLPVPLAVLFDLILTAALFVALLPLGPVAFVLGLEAAQGGLPAVQASLAEDGQAWRVASEIWRSLYVFVTVGWPGEFLSAVAGEANLPNTALLIAFFTTFTTSVWLWFALIFAPFVRLLSWTRRRGLSWLGLAINTRKRPIAPLGYAAAALILLLGAGGASIADAMAIKAAKQEPKRSAVFRDCAACPEMVMLPGGTYLMGSPKDEPGRERDEGPQTEITIAPFAIGRFEATFREWDRCVAETVSLPKAQRCRKIPRGQRRYPLKHQGKTFQLAFGDQGWGRGLRPVVTVSWNDVQIYIAWLNRKVAHKGVVYRLPSEAEWEYAARAGTKSAYSFGASAEPKGCRFMNGGDKRAGLANPKWAKRFLKCDDGYAFTAPVGSYLPNPWGVFDMHGNVWEWVADCFHGSYASRPVTGAPWMSDCSMDNSATLRGGSWLNDAGRLRSANRSGHPRVDRLSYGGFRLARTKVERR
ncbi:MAG: SUMF1/EgtB/PvdO family nonheme iron enzyme [Neomegalonema sp.]|nr:SUMF1/EgtB/PvdO family nonheme iron enzyme [Neomegalonema sp.]